MEFEILWGLLALPLTFALGWLASRLDLRQWRREQKDSPRAYFKGLNLLLNEQHDKAIDAFIEAVQHDPDTSELHFALGNLFRRRGEFERAVRVHEHLLGRADLPRSDRDRAQHALAQDFMKAGLFDRAELAFSALQGTAFDTESRLALLTLHERSRDWRAAVDVAGQLEQRGIGSFAARISHYWCEIALEADTRHPSDEADRALQRALAAAPQAARPLVLAGQRAARRGDHAQALVHWGLLLAANPTAFNLVAREYAQSAIASGNGPTARERLSQQYGVTPTLAVLDALALLDPDPAHHRDRLLAHLSQHPSLTAAAAVIRHRGASELSEAELQGIRAALDHADLPMRRYRCAACGFEAHHYFWQCPGCLGWDTFPPQTLGEL